MHKRTKKFIVDCHTPHCKYPNYPAPWGDYWIDVYVGMGRKQRLAPCVVSCPNLDKDIKIAKHVAAMKVEDENHVDGDNRVGELVRIGAELEGRVLYVVDDLDKYCNNVYVNKEFLLREDVEGTIAWFIHQRGLTGKNAKFKFRWEKSDMFAVLA